MVRLKTVVLLYLLTIFCSHAFVIKVVATVGSKVLTSREVEIVNYMLEPKKFSRSKVNDGKMSADFLREAKLRLMILEDNSQFGKVGIDANAVKRRMNKIPTKFSTKWKWFVKSYALKNEELNQYVTQLVLYEKILLEKSKEIKEQLKLYNGVKSEQQLYSEWIDQVKARIRIVEFNE